MEDPSINRIDKKKEDEPSTNTAIENLDLGTSKTDEKEVNKSNIDIAAKNPYLGIGRVDSTATKDLNSGIGKIDTKKVDKLGKGIEVKDLNPSIGKIDNIKVKNLDLNIGRADIEEADKLQVQKK